MKLIDAAVKDLRGIVSATGANCDWEQKAKAAWATREHLRATALDCVAKSQQLAATAEELPLEVGKAYFDHLKATIDTSLKFHIRGMPDGLLKKFALGHFVRWKDEAILEAIQSGIVRWNTQLDRGASLGKGMDSRAVEIPLALEQGDFATPGKVLDAGCALNHAFMHDLMPATGARVTHMTLSAEKEPALMAADRFSYVYGDLRAMDFRDNTFDRVLSISTIEHIGSDNTKYFSANGLESRKDSYLDALKEMVRVLKPGGTLFVTFPYGPYEDKGWYQVMGPDEIARMLHVVKGHKTELRYYFSDGAWYQDDAAVVQTMPNSKIEDAVAALRVVKCN